MLCFNLELNQGLDFDGGGMEWWWIDREMGD